MNEVGVVEKQPAERLIRNSWADMGNQGATADISGVEEALTVDQNPYIDAPLRDLKHELSCDGKKCDRWLMVSPVAW